MTSYAIEIILARQLADCLSMPVFITDTRGNLIFYNEAAEKILGKRFEETGEMNAEQWATIYKQKDDDGNPIAPQDLPLSRTLRDKYPYHKTFWIENLEGKAQKISVTSYPIIGRGNDFLGAVAIFWEAREL